MITRGIYSATCSILNDDFSLNVEATIQHAASSINNGLHGAIFFGSTGQSQLIDLNSKKNLISKIASHKFRKNFFIGTGCNSINETLDLIKYAFEYEFRDFLIMPPAYYKGNTEKGVYDFYKHIIKKVPKIIIILYNFEKLSSFLFSPDFVKRLVNDFPKNIIGVKDSSYNLFEKLKIPNFLIFPGSETKLLKGLKLGCSGIISAVCNVTGPLARKVYDDFYNKKKQTHNIRLCAIRSVFDKNNLISGLHSFLSIEDEKYQFILPPLSLLTKDKEKKMMSELKALDFFPDKSIAA